MPGKIAVSLWDYDGETTKVSVPTVAIDEVNLVDQDTKMSAFLGTLGGITLGVAYKDVRVFQDDLLAGASPNDKTAQRESKWLVRMHEDAAGWAKHTMEIGTADHSLLDPENKGQMIIDAGNGLAFVNSLEALYEAPNGNSIVVDSITYVGRNL